MESDQLTFPGLITLESCIGDFSSTDGAVRERIGRNTFGHSSTRTESIGEGELCETNLFLLKSQGVNIGRSHVANQDRRVFRI
jgi:hypothetical protein